MTALLEQGPSGLDSVPDDGHQVEALFAEHNLASRKSRHIQQVVDQSGQMQDLPFHHVPDVFDIGAGSTGLLQDVKSVANWTKRIAKLVAEHRYKFILTATDLHELFCPMLQLVAQSLSFRNILS